MKILKGQNLIVKSRRKRTYKGVAIRDFDTENDEWYPVAARECVYGLSTDWLAGEEVPCRRGLDFITVEGR